MRNLFWVFSLVMICSVTAKASAGDTTWVYANNVQLNYYNNFDSTVVFPNGSHSYRKIYMIMTLGEYACAAGTQYCHQWDYDLENYIMTPRGDTFELSRFITPYATTGTPGFNAAWKQHYIFDVTDYYTVLRDTGTVRVHYSGYSGGFTLDVKFAFIEGTPERNVLGINRLWNGGYSYGNPSDLIDTHIQQLNPTAPSSTLSAEMKVAITGHGQDNATGCCEFDATNVGHTYTIVANGNPVAVKNMNMNCGASELYPQGGTWAYARAGNWCPGGLVTIGQHKLTGVTAGAPYTVDMDFDDTYDGGGAYGFYNIASSVFYYGGYNKNIDASIEDIIAPTSFEWYRRENPRVGIPVIKVRNTGNATISSILFQYGVKDSAPSTYIWTGSLAPSADTIISLPAIAALSNLSLEMASGLYSFIVSIQQVNGLTDNDQTNDTLTSSFAIASTWPQSFAINMITSSIGADGSFGTSPSDASWQITDEHGLVVASRVNANVSTTYRDTINLSASGFYTLKVSTSQCVGLHWWPLDGQSGYRAGSIVVRDINSNINLPLSGNVYSGTYHDDFGCGFTQYFTTAGLCQADKPQIIRNADTLITSPGLNYQWYYNGNLIVGATHQNYVIQHSNGNYTVMVNYGNDCVGNSANYVVLNMTVVAGVNELIDLSSVTISPNPTKDAFILNVNSELISLPYTLSDLTGREVLAGIIRDESTPVHISGLAAGVFVLQVGEKSNQSFKIIKY